MFDALISGKLIKSPELKKSAKGTAFAQILMTVQTGEDSPAIISGVCFGDVAERVAKLSIGDAISVTGGIKQTNWIDKNTGEPKHGLNITVQTMLSVYDISKKRNIPVSE